MEMIGKKCIVRTYSAGVFFGTLESLDGKIGVVSHARRIWYWAGAATLSQLATEGTKKPTQCRFPAVVELVYLSEIIEVILASDAAIASIEGVPVWSE